MSKYIIEKEYFEHIAEHQLAEMLSSFSRDKNGNIAIPYNHKGYSCKDIKVKSNNKVKAISMFSGAGGLDIGFEKAGFHNVFASDNWDVACKTLKKNGVADEIVCGDIRNLDFKTIRKQYGEIDCLIGGPPCPPYSQTRHYLIGKADGFEDEHAGFAVPEYFRAVKELKPTVFIFENVDGFTFKTHQYEFDYLKEISKKLGYRLTYKVVNCADYGIPQKRERVIIFGVQNSNSNLINSFFTL